MNEQSFRNLVSGKTTGLSAALARASLAGMAVGYRAVIAGRNALFNLHWRKPRRVRVPIISVGNITTGGTGKTPVVALVVQMLQQSGKHPAIISRGYRSVDGQSNDEKLVLERLCPGVPHEQNASRLAAAKSVTTDTAVDVIVMDDGFQHRQLHRDLDIVLIDATNPFGYGHLLPRGLLREPLSSLRRADVVLITRADMATAEQLGQIEQQILKSAPQLTDSLHRVEFQPTGLIDGTGQRLPLSQLVNQSVMLLSGIGNPDAFESTCRRAGLSIAGTMWFPDHHHYTAEDIQQIESRLHKLSAARVVTTVKDLVKLPETPDFLALEIAAVLPDPQPARMLRKRLVELHQSLNVFGRLPAD